MKEKINSIGIVGAGTAGLISALMLRQKFINADIEVIKSDAIGIIGVGEGSTEHWKEFIKFVDIPYNRVIQECDATFKSGIMFKNWGSRDYLQSISTGYNYRHRKIPFVYLHQMAKGVPPEKMLSSHAWESKVNTWFIDQEDVGPTSQFHFNTNKLNDFLTNLCLERGITITDDKIVDVIVNQDGIESIKGTNKDYNFDFYIDASGFRRVLIDRLGAKWKSYSKYLKMKSAIVFPTEQGSEIPMYTTATAMDAGWMFNIPVYGRNGNGYVFDSDFIDADTAKHEVESKLGHEIEVRKEIKFDPGALEESWIKNCCAIGLSSSFVEPLEASSIGTSIQQTFLLIDLITNYDESVIKKYNKLLTGITDNIRDFIALHYLTDRSDSEFWKSIHSTEISDSLAEKLSIWKHHIPTLDDFVDTSDYRLFTDFHHILVLYGLNYFNLESIQKEYQILLSDEMKKEAETVVRDEQTLKCITVPHKIYLDIVRNMKQENYEK